MKNLVLLFMLFTAVLSAQDKYTVSGIVKEAKTEKQPLERPYF